MDKESDLRRSLLPHREDNIPELEPLLRLVLNFSFAGVGFLDRAGLQEKGFHWSFGQKKGILVN